jgi:AcrR family transcriptional regulator
VKLPVLFQYIDLILSLHLLSQSGILKAESLYVTEVAMSKQIDVQTPVKDAITKAFFTLLEKKNIAEITVSEMTALANVSRTSYYRSFDCKQDIISYFLLKTLSEMLEDLDQDFDFWTLDYGYALFTMMKRYKDTILLLDRLGYSGMILNIFNQVTEEFAGDMPIHSIARYRLYYVAGAAYNGLLCWMKNGCKESVREMVISLARFIQIDTDD